MAYVAYTGLTSPDEVIEAMADYITTRGYTVVQPLVDDLNIHDMASTDGKKFCFQNRTGDYFIELRSANGTHVFGSNDDAAMDLHALDMGSWENCNMYGVAMTVSEGYSPAARWYNQYNVPKAKGGTSVYGVFLPVTNKIMTVDTVYYPNGVTFYNGLPYQYTCPYVGSFQVNVGTVESPVWEPRYRYEKITNWTWTLYCNNIVTPSDTLVFSLVKENDTFHQTAHLLYADVHKYDAWEGGAIFSGSYSYYFSGVVHNISDHYLHGYSVSTEYLPLLCSSGKSNTFLRIDIDEAPTNVRGNILWASSGTSNETGKKLSLPIRTGDGLNGKIPHYYVLQSKSRLDWGKNINTLNCITMDMPIYGAVLVDPDLLDNYAGVGDITGIYCVSLLNMQTAGTYERNYPRSNDLDQVFPHRMRRDNIRGFDGIAIRQNESAS